MFVDFSHAIVATKGLINPARSKISAPQQPLTCTSQKPDNKGYMYPLIEQILAAQNIVLSTHTQPDGDGIGSQVALYWALKKIGKNVRIVNVDEIPRKYNFLNTH